MLTPGSTSLATIVAAPAPSTPLGPIVDGVVSWTTWFTLMGFLGVVVLSLATAGPVARRVGSDALASATTRLTRVALTLGLLSIPAVLTDTAHGLSESGGYDYRAAWHLLYDGSNGGRLVGLEITLMGAAIVLIAPLAVGGALASRLRTPLMLGAVGASAVALDTTKFPDAAPEDWGRTIAETLMWTLHLFGGAVWIGGLIGLLALAVPGAVAAGGRSDFWSPVIRRFSVAAMGCVAAISLSGLWLYWEHVDGPTQLVTTMYGRILGVKLLLFGSLLVLGMVNQFWLHPRVVALRAAGDDRSLRTLLVREFPATVAVEVLLALGVLMVAPFLHGSARNQAYQADVAHRSTVAVDPDKLPKLEPKNVSTSTWVYGSLETVVVIAIMGGAYQASGRIARRRVGRATGDSPDRELVGA